MRSQARERGSYFDPTGDQAAARVDRKHQPKTQVNYIVERATPAEVSRLQGVVFEPGLSMAELTRTRQLLQSIERRRICLISRHGRDAVRDVPEFRELNVELFRVRDILAAKPR